MRYLKDYFDGFDADITKYQWPDPFPDLDAARDTLESDCDVAEQGLEKCVTGSGKELELRGYVLEMR